MLPDNLVPRSAPLGLGGPALIVAGRSAIRLSSEDWSKTFAAVEMSHAIFPFGGECTAVEIRRGCQAAQETNARVVIGAGGGKVLDAARAIASNLSPPVVNCPTLASSDAPCSALSVIYTDAGEWEEYRSPVRHLVAGMGDALATWFEPSGLAAAHAIHNGLTTASGTQSYLHGEKVAFGLIAQLMLESQPTSVVEEVPTFSNNVGLYTTFTDVGIGNPSHELLEAVAKRATAAGETIHNEPISRSRR
jgi:glycerol dehydrogenase